MLNSFNSPAFQLACVRFLNTFLASAASCRDRVHIQCELEEAGLDMALLNRMADSAQLRDELQTWTRAYIDVNQLVAENNQLRREAEDLRRTGKELKERVSECMYSLFPSLEKPTNIIGERSGGEQKLHGGHPEVGGGLQ